MEIFNLALTIVFAGASLWMGAKLVAQRKEITIACKYLNAYRIFIMVCFGASLLTMLFGFADILDAVRTIAMTVMVGLFLCLREGAGERGFVYNGSLIAYDAVVRYDYKSDDKLTMVYIVFKETVKNGTEEGTITLKFKKEDEKEVLRLLEGKMPKKHKRMKKG